MALLPLTLALLAMTVATTAYDVIPLDMALDSIDDQYHGCGPAMKAALPALNRSEFEKNRLFAKVWPEAVTHWRIRGSRVSPLSSSAQAIAIMAYTLDDLYRQFNKKVRVAGRSRRALLKFHFKTLHFLLTDAVATLKDAQKEQKCHCVYRGVKDKLYEANVGDIVQFGQFASSSLFKNISQNFGRTTMFKVQTCHGAYIKAFSVSPKEEEVLIPPFEKFNVTKIIKGKENVQIHLDSIGTYSKYNCEWLTGGSVSRAHCHIRGLLLATLILAMASGIL